MPFSYAETGSGMNTITAIEDASGDEFNDESMDRVHISDM
jgi:hypothetical protein